MSQSREIKFRAYGPLNGDVEMFVPAGLPNPVKFDNDKTVWMQYTGLKDKNGREIYEGDIVRLIVEPKPFVTQIVWELCGLRLKDTLLGNMNESWGKDMEVIGNIYENRELLNV